MSLQYTYGSLSAALQAWSEITDNDFIAAMPDIIQKGELALYHAMDLDNLDPIVTGGAVNTTTGILPKPVNLIRERVVGIVPSSGAPDYGSGIVAILIKRNYDFLLQYLIDTAGATGTPRYYSEVDQDHWQIAPLPTEAYTSAVRGIFTPVLLGDSPEDTNLAGIAALQNTTSSSPLTLTTSPFVYEPTLEPTTLVLYSSGDMSANSFAVVGLDIDGNAQSENIAGPNAGSVSTVGVYSQITSVTPAQSDVINMVSAGWQSDNQTWLSTRFPELLYYFCQLQACEFNKRWTAGDQVRKQIQALMPAALLITRSLRRNDFDDIYSGRQNVGAPGAVTLPVPPQSGAQPGQE